MKAKSSVSNLEQHLGYWMRFVSNHISHAFAQKVEAQGVTVAEWAVMRQMFDVGAVNPSQLAELMGMTRGAISKLVERLCSKGLMERTAGTVDQRFQTIALTAKARKLVPVLASLADENDREYFGHLHQRQQADLVNLLKDIVLRHGWKDLPVR